MDTLSTYDPRQGLPSASAFGRLALCPGSFTLEQSCPDEISAAANEGTLLHAYMEQLLTGEPWEGAPLDCGTGGTLRTRPAYVGRGERDD